MRMRDSYWPKCRQPMPANMANCVVGALIEEVEHKCKNSDQGCEVKMMLKPLLSHEDTCLKVKRRCKHSDKGCKVRLTLKDLKVHEKSCPERTFKCPYNNCGLILKLEDFDEHALNTPGPAFDSHSVFGDSNFRLPISVREERLKPKLKLSMSEFPLFNLFRGNFDHETKPVHVIKKRQMHCVRAHGELFHVRLDYHQPQHCFVLSIWTAKSELGASKFRADVKIDYPHFNFRLDDKDQETSTKSLLITSVENVPSIDNCIVENGKHFWCIPFDFAMNSSVMTRKPNSISIFQELRGNVRVIKLPDARRLCISSTMIAPHPQKDSKKIRRKAQLDH